MDTLVRFPNETTYHSTVDIDVTELTNIMKFPTEVFATFKGVRIAIRRNDYDAMIQANNKD